MTRITSKLLFIVLILAFAAGNYGCSGMSAAPDGAVLTEGGVDTDATPAAPDASINQVIRHTADGIEVPFAYLAGDSGWSQPYIEPRRETAMPAPSWELLQECIQAERERGLIVDPCPQTTRATSWLDQDGYNGLDSILKGEYSFGPAGVDPPYGCNSNGANSANGHALEDVIVAGSHFLPHAICYVLEGNSQANWFNTTGGTSNSAYSSVYQLFATSRNADPEDWGSGPYEFEELTYRSDLAPGVPPGGDCSAATAYLIGTMFWKRFNSVTNALPNLEETELFNILIAPASDVTSLFTSSGNTDGRFQQFYFGNVLGCYGGAWITGLEAADTTCEVFNDSVNSAFAANDPFHYRPIYGLLLKRWQETQASGMAGPWAGDLGWPVYGPIAYANGAQHLSAQGAYYAWGIWYEKGFCWWVDYDQACYPASLDEAQLYGFTGCNVYCEDGEYFRWGPAVFYGGETALGGTAVVDYYRFDAGDPWQPLRLTEDGTVYNLPIPTGETTVAVAMHCTGYGGLPNPDWSYDYYNFDFGDGEHYEGTNPFCVHTYDTDEPDFFVRVQITDDDSNTAYADSLPVHFESASERKAVLLMSQSHGFDADFSGTNAWDALYGFTVQSGSVASGERDMIWAAGLATDAGVGPGGTSGVFPTAPQNVSGELGGIFSRDSAGCAERYSGIGSSGRIPLELGFDGAWQFCGLGYYGSLMAGNEASPGFRAGLAAETDVPCAPVAFLSWGNIFAPDSGIGFSPDYSHALGERRLWVVGYPWAQVTTDMEMTRADLLHNILGWLDSTVGERNLPTEIMLVRVDGDVFDANYDALYDDLDSLGLSVTSISYCSDLAEQFHADPYKIAIWYRGGPGDSEEPQTHTTAWSSAEAAEFLEMLD